MAIETAYQSFEVPGKEYYKLAGIEMPETFEVRHMTVKEVRYFSSLGETGDIDSFADSVLKACIRTKFDINSMLSGDRLYLFYILRALTMDNIYKFETICQECSKTIVASADIFKFPKKDYNPENGFPIKVTLPRSNAGIEFVLANRGIDKQVDSEVKKFNKEFPNSEAPSAVYLLKRLVKSVNGSTDTIENLNFIESLHFMDWRTIDKKINEVSPGLDLDVDVPCENCGFVSRVRMSIRISEFFLLGN